MRYVIGVDLGTSAVKVLLVDEAGTVCETVSKAYPIYQEQSGYREQRPEDWVDASFAAIRELVARSGVSADQIEGLSLSGQMHGLVLLNEADQPLRNAILWNDTRTTEQCREIEEKLGDKLLTIAQNPALEGFTLPKLLWVREHEPELFIKVASFMLPKDYVRLRLTGERHAEYSDAAGTLLLDVARKMWSGEICEAFALDPALFPPLVASTDCVGRLTAEAAERTGLRADTKVFAGGADNACGAAGAGVLEPGKSMCSIGTSGVVLSYQPNERSTFNGELHYFNHAAEDAWYAMGVTLAAGDSLSWFKQTFNQDGTFEELLADLPSTPIGANGLLFTPYLSGERTPHGDADIRGSFIGIDSSHKRADFVRAVVEGITFSLNESIVRLREAGQPPERIVAIGGGAKNEHWLQIQADVFNTPIVQLENEQGPGMGAAMIAAVGCGWYPSLAACAESFVKEKHVIEPIEKNVKPYERLFPLYQTVYGQTKRLSKALQAFR